MIAFVIISFNPVNSLTTIKNAGDSTLSIYDMNGRLVFSKVILRDRQEIDLSSLASGVYFSKIKGVSAREVVKLVKE